MLRSLYHLYSYTSVWLYIQTNINCVIVVLVESFLWLWHEITCCNEKAMLSGSTTFMYARAMVIVNVEGRLCWLYEQS